MGEGRTVRLMYGGSQQKEHGMYTKESGLNKYVASGAYFGKPTIDPRKNISRQIWMSKIMKILIVCTV
jgi:hypothetical protein